tara:strand:- start:59 stop:487 length:429 start_codon:yes stop_codon:yes gene_type:complete
MKNLLFILLLPLVGCSQSIKGTTFTADTMQILESDDEGYYSIERRKLVNVEITFYKNSIHILDTNTDSLTIIQGKYLPRNGQGDRHYYSLDNGVVNVYLDYDVVSICWEWREDVHAYNTIFRFAGLKELQSEGRPTDMMHNW